MIEIKNLNKYYNKGQCNELHIIKNLNLKIGDGEMLAIVGKSGVGKSTLLHIMACLDNVDSGEVIINNVDITKLNEKNSAKFRGSKVSIIMQDFALIEDFTVLDNVLIPFDFTKEKKQNKKQTVLKTLASLGIKNLANKRVNLLSGGEKQRVAIARSLITNPEVIFADEPTGSLDEINARHVLNILKQINASGKTIVIVTHDMDLANQCKRKVVMTDGQIKNYV